VKVRQLVVLRGKGDLDGIAADFAIFDVRLAENGGVKDHRYLFAAIRTHEGEFHMNATLSHIMTNGHRPTTNPSGSYPLEAARL
jgi:hypothetical protein